MEVDVVQLNSLVGAMWVSVALLTGGFAHGRGRTGLGWFLLALIFGPIAVLFLVLLQPRRAA
jgi:hypothetical protein